MSAEQSFEPFSEVEYLKIWSPVCKYLLLQWHLVQEQVQHVQSLVINLVSFSSVCIQHTFPDLLHPLFAGCVCPLLPKGFVAVFLLWLKSNLMFNFLWWSLTSCSLSYCFHFSWESSKLCIDEENIMMTSSCKFSPDSFPGYNAWKFLNLYRFS